MQRLISLFASPEDDPRLSQPASGPPPSPPPPDYGREPEYFRYLLAYLREQKRAGEASADSLDGGIAAPAAARRRQLEEVFA